MKKNILLFGLFFLGHHALLAQNCAPILPSSTVVLPNDTTITMQNVLPNITEVYFPCKSLKIDSAITVQNYIYLRPGSSFTADSLSTLYGGFFIYADSGSTVDMNFKAATVLYYQSGAVLKDTNQGNAFLCNNLVFDFSQMIANPNCIALTKKNIPSTSKIKVANASTSWNIYLMDKSERTNWKLFSLDGQIIQTGFTNISQIEIDKQSLAPGLYVLRLQHKGEFASLKLLRE